MVADPTQTAQSLRQAMRRYPAAISLVVARDADRGFAGMVATSVTSASMDPPLMMVAIRREGRMNQIVRRSEKFGLVMLAHDDADLIDVFAKTTGGVANFTQDRWDLSGPLPHLTTGAASIVCTLHAIHPAGSHDLFIGGVHEVRLGPQSQSMVWYQSAAVPLNQ